MKKILSTSRFLRASRLFAAVLALGFAGGAAAQQNAPILTIDQDRLFAETSLGAAAIQRLEVEAQRLASENQRIEGELIAEERELTEKRAELPAEEFRELANAFDTRVQQIRTEQDEKARLLTRQRDEARSTFFRDAAGIISEIVRARGALVVIDRRDVFLSADTIDITDEAIERINEAESVTDP